MSRGCQAQLRGPWCQEMSRIGSQGLSRACQLEELPVSEGVKSCEDSDVSRACQDGCKELSRGCQELSRGCQESVKRCQEHVMRSQLEELLRGPWCQELSR